MTTGARAGGRGTHRPHRLGSRVMVGIAAMVASTSFAVPTIALPTEPTGTIGVRLLDQPASTAGDPRALIYIVDHLPPGTEIRRRIEVSTTTTAARVRLYAGAASIIDGSFLGAPGDTPNELSTWTSVTPGEIDMVSGQVATANVVITVPGDAAPGERYGVVWAETRSPAASDGGVTQVNRVGIRLYLSVGPGGPPAADFTIDSLAAGRSTDGVRRVDASVHNTGGRALDISGSLDLRTTSGELHAGPYPADVGTTLAIGETRSVVIPISTDLPAGPWDALITLRSGLVERSASAELTFPDQGTSPAVSAEAGGNHQSLLMWSLFVLALLATTLLVVLVVRSKGRRRSAREDASTATFTA